MVDISIIIVNYNVQHFLEQCLHSVYKAKHELSIEVIVVDNQSVDGSVVMVRERFPQTIIIENNKNIGFSKANNQGIKIAKGKYVLLLNPDTVIEEDTLRICHQFMEKHEDAGACGVKHIDGKGKYLPESKRGFPSPDVAFYKMSGLSALFPKSRRFGRYHLGFLDADKVHEIDVLSGAFMFIRKKVLDKVGLLDEDFFMYGEDIDLSYRITCGGYKIYYLPETRIIHYRGESTKKGSFNYVYVFYQAMIIFASKHFSGSNVRLFTFFIHLAVYSRASISFFKRIFSLIWLPAIEILSYWGGLYILKNYWANKSGVYYPYTFMWIAVPLYILAWISWTWIYGGYDKPYRITKALKGLIAGTVLILIIYALLPEYYRFSRFLTLVGATYAMGAATAIRLSYNFLIYKRLHIEDGIEKRILIIGDFDEATRINTLLQQSPVKTIYMGVVHHDPQFSPSSSYIGNISRLKELVEVLRINELIFCGQNLSSAQIMDHMMQIQHPELEYKIAPPESLFIVGSNSIHTSGSFYTVGLNSINKTSNKRNKRMLDITLSTLLILCYPVLLLIVKQRKYLFRNLSGILRGKLSFVGYAGGKNEFEQLPHIKSGILHPLDAFPQVNPDRRTIEQANMLYAKDYRVINDLEVITASLPKLGR